MKPSDPRALRRPERVRPVRVALYEPLGQGGICHYTHALAQALSHRPDCDVTLLTPGRYELESRPRQFRIFRLDSPSRVKRLLVRGARLWPRRRPADGSAGSPDGSPAPGKAARSPRTASPVRRTRIRLRQLGLALRLLAWRTDVVHFQWLDPTRDLFLFRLLRRLGLRLIHTAHNVLPHDGLDNEERLALDEIYRNADRVIVHSEGNRRDLHSEFAVGLEGIAVVAHGSYDFLLPDDPTGPLEARAQVGFPAAGRILLFFGLIRRYKGLEYLVEAFGLVERRFPDARLAIVGQIPDADTDDHAYYSRLLERASRNSSILYVPEYVPVDRVGLYFLAADVVVLPYVTTSQSGVLMAALAAGRPVIVTDTGAMAEVVENGKTGFVVPPRDAAALADAMARILDRPETAARMGRQASELALTNLSWETIADQTRDLYQQVLGERRQRRPRPRP